MRGLFGYCQSFEEFQRMQSLTISARVIFGQYIQLYMPKISEKCPKQTTLG